MKVKIGGYLTFWGPYQIAEKILFWIPKYDENYHRSDTVHKFGQWLAGKDHDTWLAKFCEWVHSKRKRTIKVHIDNYDVWSMDSTLAVIILPMLKKLKEAKHGSGQIDNADVPEHLRSEIVDYCDPKVHEKYEWFLDELIWTFEQLHPEYDWEAQYCSEKCELDLDPHPDDEGKIIVPVRWKNEGKYDWDGMKAHRDRIANGTRLFGTYFQTLWD